MIDGIKLDGWSFDGRGGMHGLGGSLVTSASGGAFYLTYCGDSHFTLEVINCLTSQPGGAYFGYNSTYNLTIANITSCRANNGGACYELTYCTISNIHDCYSYVNPGSRGGACYHCDHCNISHIYDCESGAGSSGGGAVANSDYCNISHIYRCHTGEQGGACAWCDYSNISHIYDCVSSRDGGACYSCNNCNISNIHRCNASLNGGAISQCGTCNISNIYDCWAAYGGAIYGSNHILVSGAFRNNQASTNGDVIWGIYLNHFWTGQFVYGVTPTKVITEATWVSSTINN